jgi:hypothetical protein
MNPKDKIRATAATFSRGDIGVPIIWPDSEVERLRDAVVDWLANAGHLRQPWSRTIVGEELVKAVADWRWYPPLDEQEREAVAYWALERLGLEPAEAFLTLAKAYAANRYYDPLDVVSEVRRAA